ncbi:acyl-coenzyme A thioesterase 13-like [Crassostrea virginica]|uniref:Acyl-coenzyme A thioesterase 13 n=1 Tax=Crassostrea virginica TaxID=6565 RepID=A0A8B8CH90_CRAVI|nr:acyl-coenzyme A thioesterase 13-like [Crassostrea virginica]XP_022315075.1 acyl-coenzyme A thioesterase 13-like [Crassostrea virginica]
MSETDNEGLRIAKDIAFGRIFGHKRFENILQKISIVSGGGGNVTCEFGVEEEHRNSHGTLHGGLMSLLVDAITTWALHTKVRDRNSASIDLSLRFIKPARVGETVVIEAKTTRCGRRVAFLSADIRSKDGQLLAQGFHTKLLMEPGAKL